MALTPPGTHRRQFLVSRGRNILYPKSVIVVIIVNSVLIVHIIWRNGWRKMHQNAQTCMLQFNIVRGLCPGTPCWGGAAVPFPKSHLPRHPRASLGPQTPPPRLLAAGSTGRWIAEYKILVSLRQLVRSTGARPVGRYEKVWTLQQHLHLTRMLCVVYHCPGNALMIPQCNVCSLHDRLNLSECTSV